MTASNEVRVVIARLGAAHVVIVYHPYYQAFAEWACEALSPNGETRYRRAAGLLRTEPAARAPLHPRIPDRARR